jgi:uncharacterized protein YkwD
MTGVVRSMVAVLAVGAAFALAPVAGAAPCGRAADLEPAAPGASLRAARVAALCLLNAERARYGEQRLRFNGRLALAGVRHARDMVSKRYFAHSTPAGESFIQRIFNASYVPPGSHWHVAENLGWGAAAQSTPRWIVTKWMHSPEHRHNILDGRLRDIGIAIVLGAPYAGKRVAATYDTEFGVVRRLH